MSIMRAWSVVSSQKAVLDRVAEAHAAGRLPQAILLEGPEGIGKKRLAWDIALLLGCEAQVKPCGSCFYCRMLADPGAVDRWLVPLLVEPAEREKAEKLYEATAKILAEVFKNPYKIGTIPSSGVISVHQVRLLWQKLSLKADHTRVVMIPHAEAMNDHAANALLKTLEEAPPETYFILTTANRRALLPTVLSRCVPVGVPAQTADEVRLILEAHGYGEPSADDLGFASGSAGKAMECLEAQLSQHLQQGLRFWESLVAGDVSGLIAGLEEWPGNDLSQARFFLETLAVLCQDLIRLQAGTAARLPHFATVLGQSGLMYRLSREKAFLWQGRVQISLQRLQERKGSATQVLQNLVLTAGDPDD